MLRLRWFIIILMSVFKIANSGPWPCGGAQLDGDSSCICGDTILTSEDYFNYKDCCGKDSCYVDQDGNAQCPDGHICQDTGFTFRCGDTRLPDDGVCWCGEEILEGRDYNRFNSTSTTDKWCCPASSSCSYEEDGNTVVCTNGTILKGRKAKCSSGVNI